MEQICHFKRRTKPSASRPSTKSKKWRRIAALGLTTLATALFLSCPAASYAAKITERTKQKQAVENQRSDLQKKLSALKRSIDQTEAAKGHAADALAQSAQAISEANRVLFELAEEMQRTVAKLAQLTEQRNEIERTVELQQKHLAKVLRDQYVAGSEDRLKLLLSGDNPNRINRALHYLAYVSQAQARLVESLRANLQDVAANQAGMQNARDEQDEISREAQAQKLALEQEKRKHATLVSELSNKLADQRKEAGTLQRDEQRMTGLVSKLGQLIAEQASAAAAAKQREQDLARARAQRKKQQALLAKMPSIRARPEDQPGTPDAIDADEDPAESLAHNELTPETAVQKGLLAGTFSALRGRLRLPVRGDIMAKFGSKRDDGPNWKGLFIRTAEGAEVRTVAGGQVIFADWLRGFGNLIIIDHGGQYMSIYGNNQAVLKRTGDIIKSGDVIASAGNSGANEQSGLYFEMRHKGRAFDPLDWVTIR